MVYLKHIPTAFNSEQFVFSGVVERKAFVSLRLPDLLLPQDLKNSLCLSGKKKQKHVFKIR